MFLPIGQTREEVKPFVFSAETTGNYRGGKLFPSSLPGSLAGLITNLIEDRLTGEKQV